MMNNLDQAVANAEAARNLLAESVAAGQSIAQLSYRMVNLAEAEGELKVHRLISVMDKNDIPVNERIEELARMLAYGSDDSGSGRGNDLRRSEFDGVRKSAARELSRLYIQLDNQIND